MRGIHLYRQHQTVLNRTPLHAHLMIGSLLAGNGQKKELLAGNGQKKETSRVYLGISILRNIAIFAG